MEGLQEHWEKVYTTKGRQDVSWTQLIPETSLRMIGRLMLPADAAVIDIGGGDSKLAACLIGQGYENISVLDISAAALERAKSDMGSQSANVKWFCADINHYVPHQRFALWHDRAAFHFLTEKSQIDNYISMVKNCVTDYLIIATFSDIGPLRCSGLEVRRYDAGSLADLFAADFEMIESFAEDHQTPFGTFQNFTFCCFRRKNLAGNKSAISR